MRRDEGEAVHLSEVRRVAAGSGGRAARERTGGRCMQSGGSGAGALSTMSRELLARHRGLVAAAFDVRRAGGLSPESAAAAVAAARHPSRPAARRRAARFRDGVLVARFARTSRTPHRRRQHAEQGAPAEVTHSIRECFTLINTSVAANAILCQLNPAVIFIFILIRCTLLQDIPIYPEYYLYSTENSTTKATLHGYFEALLCVVTLHPVVVKNRIYYQFIDSFTMILVLMMLKNFAFSNLLYINNVNGRNQQGRFKNL